MLWTQGTSQKQWQGSPNTEVIQNSKGNKASLKAWLPEAEQGGAARAERVKS